MDSCRSAAAAVGMADQRYRQAKEVVEAAEQDAAQFGDIAETMDTTGNVMSAADVAAAGEVGVLLAALGR